MRSAGRWARRRRALVFCCSCALTAAGCSSDAAGDACKLEDADGIIGGKYTFLLRIGDQAFDPIIITAQNKSDATLTLDNQGTTENGFRIDCLPTPNDDGCANSSCFPDSHVIQPIAVGASETVEFRIPEVEGIYVFRSLPNDDQRTGQFIVE